VYYTKYQVWHLSLSGLPLVPLVFLISSHALSVYTKKERKSEAIYSFLAINQSPVHAFYQMDLSLLDRPFNPRPDTLRSNLCAASGGADAKRKMGVGDTPPRTNLSPTFLKGKNKKRRGEKQRQMKQMI